jgi:phosphoglycerate dehydrogenase-like enzyme
VLLANWANAASDSQKPLKNGVGGAIGGAFVRPEDIEREIGTADALIPEHVQVNAALLERALALKLVQTGAGYNNVNLDDCTRRGGACAGIRPLLV